MQIYIIDIFWKIEIINLLREFWSLYIIHIRVNSSVYIFIYGIQYKKYYIFLISWKLRSSNDYTNKENLFKMLILTTYFKVIDIAIIFSIITITYAN